MKVRDNYALEVMHEMMTAEVCGAILSEVLDATLLEDEVKLYAEDDRVDYKS